MTTIALKPGTALSFYERSGNAVKHGDSAATITSAAVDELVLNKKNKATKPTTAPAVEAKAHCSSYEGLAKYIFNLNEDARLDPSTKTQTLANGALLLFFTLNPTGETAPKDPKKSDPTKHQTRLLEYSIEDTQQGPKIIAKFCDTKYLTNQHPHLSKEYPGIQDLYSTNPNRIPFNSPRKVGDSKVVFEAFSPEENLAQLKVLAQAEKEQTHKPDITMIENKDATTLLDKYNKAQEEYLKKKANPQPGIITI